MIEIKNPLQGSGLCSLCSEGGLSPSISKLLFNCTHTKLGFQCLLSSQNIRVSHALAWLCFGEFLVLRHKFPVPGPAITAGLVWQVGGRREREASGLYQRTASRDEGPER